MVQRGAGVLVVPETRHVHSYGRREQCPAAEARRWPPLEDTRGPPFRGHIVWGTRLQGPRRFVRGAAGLRRIGTRKRSQCASVRQCRLDRRSVCRHRCAHARLHSRATTLRPMPRSEPSLETRSKPKTKDCGIGEDRRRLVLPENTADKVCRVHFKTESEGRIAQF